MPRNTRPTAPPPMWTDNTRGQPLDGEKVGKAIAQVFGPELMRRVQARRRQGNAA